MYACIFRFNDQWRFVIQRLAYLAALKVYLSEERLISQQEVADMLGGKTSAQSIVIFLFVFVLTVSLVLIPYAHADIYIIYIIYIYI